MNVYSKLRQCTMAWEKLNNLTRKLETVKHQRDDAEMIVWNLVQELPVSVLPSDVAEWAGKKQSTDDVFIEEKRGLM